MLFSRRPPRLHVIRGIYHVRFNDGNRRRSVSLHTRSEKYATDALLKLEGEYLSGRLDPWSSDPRIPVDKLVLLFLAHKKNQRRKPRTIAVLKEVLSKVSSLDYDTLARVVYQGSPAPNTIKRRITTIKGFLRWCESKGHTGCPQFMEEEMPKVYPSPPRYLTQEQYKALMDKAEGWVRDACFWGIHTGFRAGTIVKLTWPMVFKDHVTVTSLEAKTKGYTVPLFFDPPNRKKEGYVLGKEHRVDLLSHKFSQLRDELGWPKDYTFHVLRHTFASWLVMGGVDLYTVSKWMGHSSIKVTERYAHLARYHNATIAKGVFKGTSGFGDQRK